MAKKTLKTPRKANRRFAEAHGYAAAISDASLMLRIIDQAITHGILIARKSPCHRKIKAIRAALRPNDQAHAPRI